MIGVAGVEDLAELPVLVLPWPALDGADGAAARLLGHVQLRPQTGVIIYNFANWTS